MYSESDFIKILFLMTLLFLQSLLISTISLARSE
jgi:hypothetical protein